MPAAYLATGHAIAWRDSTLFFAPLRALVEPALRSLQLPLWNPHEALGQPLLAQLNHAVLHPVSLLGAWLLPGAGPDLAVVAFVFLAAAGAAVAALQLGATAPAAVLGGLAYGLSGYVLGMSAHPRLPVRRRHRALAGGGPAPARTRRPGPARRGRRRRGGHAPRR